MQVLELSFCMPVYNCEPYIGAALESIKAQAIEQGLNDRIEVVVLDGASTDGTCDVVQRYQREWSAIRLIRLQEKGGIDADMAASIDHADAPYCWLISGDDCIRPGAVAAALEMIRSARDVYLCRHTHCDLQMRWISDYPVSSFGRQTVINLADRKQRLDYLKHAITTEAIFSFMSTLIVRRETWLLADTPEEFAGSCWGHVARLLTVAARRQLDVCYVPELWVDKRGDNDSFASGGYVRRLAIAVDGYSRIAERFFGADSLEAREISRLLQNDLPFPVWMLGKIKSLESPARESRTELLRLLDICYAHANVRRIYMPALVRWTPTRLYRRARSIRNSFRERRLS